MIRIIGAGLAGSEAAWQLACRGIPVELCEMKPAQRSAAHTSGLFAELVCSNSLRSDRLSNAVGVLKAEMELLGSLIMKCARKSAVPAGGALAVDRDVFSRLVTDSLMEHPNIKVREEEVQSIGWPAGEGGPDAVIVAAGPLCTEPLTNSIAKVTGSQFLSFFDAVAPIVSGESVDMEHAFWGSRYDRGSDYVNCPMTRDEYDRFYEALISAERAPVHAFEENMVFEGCMPIESMAVRGYDTMRFGPLKPKGLSDPRTGKEPYAVVQLRKEDEEGRLLNIVGFQTRLRFSEQKRVFRLIPALEDAEFMRFGVMHRNTFLKSPGVLDEFFRLKSDPRIRFAGQITGVEGYVESAASGLLAGIFTALEALGQPLPVFPKSTALGALCAHVSNTYTKDYQPSNISFGLMDPLDRRVRRKEERNLQIAERALQTVRRIREECGLDIQDEDKQ